MENNNSGDECEPLLPIKCLKTLTDTRISLTPD